MIRIVVIFLVALIATSNSFAPLSYSHSKNTAVWARTKVSDEEDVFAKVNKAFTSALLCLTLIASPNMTPTSNLQPSAANAVDLSFFTAVAGKTGQPAKSEDVEVLKELEKETREVEKEALRDLKREKYEESRKRYFDYDAKMAAELEDRIEALERESELEYEKDKATVEELKRKEEKIEEEVKMARTKEEAAKKRNEAKELLAKEKEFERRERRAERLERKFLAEEQQEKKILEKKLAADKEEEQRVNALQKEYEEVAELAKEDELELKLLKDLARKSK
jgi:hypothetical protein